MIKYCCLIFIVFRPQWLTLELTHSQWIMWNVGQGQWLTRVENDRCWHFDFGGEKNPIAKVYRYCSWRNNILILSHPDRDHYSFAPSILKSLHQICLFGPSWTAATIHKTGLHSVKSCMGIREKGLELYDPQIEHPKDDNQNSQIALEKSWLTTGDAPQSTERAWLRLKAPHLTQVRHLVLGHHGSKTSTSSELLQSLPFLRQCIASSRRKKYGHPHQDVRHRVKGKCALLLTEEWNHLHFFEAL